MTNLTRDQGILQAIAALCRDLDNNKMPSYLCNDWSSEAPMRSCEYHDNSLMATRESGPASSRLAPRGPVRVDAAACTFNSASGPHLEGSVPTNGTLDQEEYLTDDFRINSFKVADCQNREPHDWTLCVFAHFGEKARRRDPAVYKYVATACPDFRKGTCKRGDVCPFAHGVFESWLHPGKYRTQLCKDGVQCSRPVCFFAHTMQQLRLGSLPASLRGTEGAQFAAYYGGSAHGRMRASGLGHTSTGEPSSPDASSTSGESSAALMPEGSLLGSSVSDEIEWLQGSHKDQLRRLAAMSVNTGQCRSTNTGLGEILPPALQASLKAQLAAFLLGDSAASSTAMRSAAQLVQLLDPPPLSATQALTHRLPAALPPCRPHSGHASMPVPASQVQACACGTGRCQVSQALPPGGHHQAVPYSMGMPPSSSTLPVTVPPLVASIWGPLPSGRPSPEWRPSSREQPQQATPAPGTQLLSEQPPPSTEHCPCSAY